MKFKDLVVPYQVLHGLGPGDLRHHLSPILSGQPLRSCKVGMFWVPLITISYFRTPEAHLQRSAYPPEWGPPTLLLFRRAMKTWFFTQVFSNGDWHPLLHSIFFCTFHLFKKIIWFIVISLITVSCPKSLGVRWHIKVINNHYYFKIFIINFYSENSHNARIWIRCPQFAHLTNKESSNLIDISFSLFLHC